ncbi:DotI/IcmL/TraM family protein [Rhizobium leguminosarum]|uniref:DotI/IcmL/TraM family protein n=1 Tax=Rhizobium leguminosarum TaxID=384 RepID=UPI002E1679F5|nr:DotI/IcmL/TraM family protein [Rhizobium leguminosarum]
MAGQRSVWPSAEMAVASILLADVYANARLHFVSRICAGAILGAMILFLGFVALWDRPPQYRYILTNREGIVVEQVPLAQRNHDDKFVTDWAVDAITRLYTFDYENYRLQFQDAKKNLTQVGWDSFQKAMMDSGNFNAVVGYKYVTSAAPTGPGRIIKTGSIRGVTEDIDGARTIEDRYAWKIEFPMVISYRSSKLGSDGRPLVSEQNLTMSVTVIRVPEFLNQAGLGIRAIVAE